MVCKEEVLLWFKDLDGYKRIDVLYELLNMCVPFELRFIGSCIEELGKHTYQELRGPNLTANDLEKLSKDVTFNQGILDENVRHRVLVYMSLLSSRNYSVANWLYKKVLRTDHIEDYLVKEKGKEDVLVSEFLLLYTMALHHPAFTFDQKQFFSKVLGYLIDFRENRVSAKHCALGYPPGFGYPTQKIHDMPTIPVKTTPTSCGDTPSTFQHPPGLTHLPPPPPPHIDFITPMWSRPGFPYGAPEVPPFPPPSISPLVSQAASPSHSRNTSPHRTPMSIRPPPPPQVLQPPPGGPPPNVPMNGPPPPLDIMPVSVQPQPPLDQLSQSSLPMYSNPDLKLAEEELAKLSSMTEEKHIMWPQQAPPLNEVKPNGIRFPHFLGNVKPFLVEQMQALNLEGENCLHQSNSSSNSSPNGTPPSTPLNSTPATTPHGPGRGDHNKSRPNGMPQFGVGHNTTPPPPPPTAFSNSSVPYSYPQPFTALPPNRSMFHYTQAFRPAYTPPYQNYPTDNSFSTYTYPYMSLIISSHYPPRTPPGCYNCGAPNHQGIECPSQNIEEITQKKAYQLEYTSPLPDPEK